MVRTGEIQKAGMPRYTSKKVLREFLEECGAHRTNLTFQTVCDRTGWRGGKLRRLIRGERGGRITLEDAQTLQRAIKAPSLDRVAFALDRRLAEVEDRKRSRNAVSEAIAAANAE